MAKREMAKRERDSVQLRIPAQLAGWYSKQAARAGVSRNRLMERWLLVLEEVTQDYKGFLDAQSGERAEDLPERIGWHVVAVLSGLGIESAMMGEAARERDRRVREMLAEVEADRRGRA